MATLTSEVVTTQKEMELLRQEMVNTLSDRGLGHSAIDKFRFETSFQPILKQTLYRFATEILADKLVDDTYKANYPYKVPKTWWQMFKRDHLPTWFKKKFPVQYEHKTGRVKVRFKRYATYPKANEIFQGTPLFYQFGGFESIKDVVYQEQF
jgi:hypothetical protein